MKLWLQYLAWFAGLKDREKKVVALAALFGGLFLGYSYGIEPSLLKAGRDSRAAAEATTTLSTLTQQSAMLQALNQDPDAPLRKQIEALKADLGAQDARFTKVQNSLVPPEKMTALMGSLLSRGSALQLVSLRTLPPQPVIQRKAAVLPEVKDKVPLPAEARSEAVADVPDGAPSLYKHGVEIKLVGSYADLLAYVRALESAPQRLLWGQMDLTTLEYPRSQLTLTVFTLSMEKSWLVL
jgi:MSHA biogenesis protein MshJ